MIKKHLEANGIQCWLDIEQVGGVSMILCIISSVPSQYCSIMSE